MFLPYSLVLLQKNLNAVQSFTVNLRQIYGFLFHPAKVKVLPFPCCKLTEVLFFDLLPIFFEVLLEVTVPNVVAKVLIF